MLTRKPCKWCGSVWHSKNKCEKRQKQALPDGFIQKRPNTPLSPEKPSERLRTPHSDTSERTALIRKADKVFSPYIRMRNMTWYRTNFCFTCGDELPWGMLQNGHFMSRRYMVTRWDEMNCNPQCNECNVVKQGNLAVYEKKLREKYGDEAVDNLIHRARAGGKVTLAEIQAIIDKYSE